MSEAKKIKIGPWTVSPTLNLLEHGTRSIKIEPRAMDVLVCLARHDGAVVSVEELLKFVWQGVVVSDSSVYLAIRQLRQALDRAADGTQYIETIPKRGYRLTAPVEPVEPDAAPAVAPARIHATERRPRIGLAIALACVLLAGVAFAVWRTAPTVAEHSVAVLPFENLSSDPEQEYFADGVTEEILNTLARVRDLRVIGRTSSFHFRNRDDDFRDIGERLDVRHLLSGSLRKAGGQIRITAQLSDARTGHQLWSETYERKLDDVFVIQDEIAKSVAKALQIKLGVGDIGREPGMTRNVAAYDEYLRALALNLDGSFSPAIAHLQRAVALDPSYSVAWSGLNGVYTNGALGMPAEQADEWQRLGTEALERARALTPDAPHVLLQIAIGEARRTNWLVAAPLYAGLEPALAKYGAANKAWGPRGVFLMYVGRERDAIPALERARADDPLAPVMAGFLGQAYLARGDFAAALAEADRGIELQGGGLQRLHGLAFWIAMNKNDRLEIERRLHSLREISGSSARPSRLSELANLLDSPAAAEAEIRRIASLESPNERIPLALWAAHMQAPELSLELLAKEAANGEMMPVLWQPMMRDARKLPAFKDLVRAAGLVDYWRAYGWSDFCRPIGDEDFECG